MSLRLSFLWRASLLALGCAAAPGLAPPIYLKHCIVPIGAASQPNASKLARHMEWGGQCSAADLLVEPDDYGVVEAVI
ncbi:hypothetical protein CXQ82_13325 [Pseudomonas sp. S09G 359]|nr:hypothetical protein CXQ82_13325 [Pseudomonas sp. S09G 359]